MDSDFSRELARKQLVDLITDIYEELNQKEEILSAPDNDHGLFKYIGMNPQSQFYLSKMSKKRDVQRAGLGFVIQRAELLHCFRLSFDIEISKEVTGKDPTDIIADMTRYAQTEFGMRAPEFIIYVQPAHSGQRGWADKTFVGVELEVNPDDIDKNRKLKKGLIDSAHKLFQALDFALT
ncbi:MAG: hypothetical protein JXR73_04705 [Candidatus Omnitrophica bacterium]|nr:hypothetical protein [Candidatus Omnitrophota bacterium]